MIRFEQKNKQEGENPFSHILFYSRWHFENLAATGNTAWKHFRKKTTIDPSFCRLARMVSDSLSENEKNRQAKNGLELNVTWLTRMGRGLTGPTRKRRSLQVTLLLASRWSSFAVSRWTPCGDEGTIYTYYAHFLPESTRTTSTGSCKCSVG